MLVNERRKICLDSADPQNRSEWSECHRGRPVRQAGRRKECFKMDTMMMNMLTNLLTPSSKEQWYEWELCGEEVYDMK